MQCTVVVAVAAAEASRFWQVIRDESGEACRVLLLDSILYGPGTIAADGPVQGKGVLQVPIEVLRLDPGRPFEENVAAIRSKVEEIAATCRQDGRDNTCKVKFMLADGPRWLLVAATYAAQALHTIEEFVGVKVEPPRLIVEAAKAGGNTQHTVIELQPFLKLAHLSRESYKVLRMLADLLAEQSPRPFTLARAAEVLADKIAKTEGVEPGDNRGRARIKSRIKSRLARLRDGKLVEVKERGGGRRGRGKEIELTPLGKMLALKPKLPKPSSR